MKDINNTGIDPAGYYCLIKMADVKDKTESGLIIKTSDSIKREKVGNCVGQILAFGPAAFKNLSSGVNSPEDWGVKVGDMVEFTSYDGKVPKTAMDDKGESNLRLIQDQHIIAKVG
jgi:co-chaperonin GroES (HSP10)